MAKIEDQSRIMDLLKGGREFSFKGKESDFISLFVESLDEVIDELRLPKIAEVKQNCKIKTDGNPVFADVVILHEDDSLTVIEAKCSKKGVTTTQVRAIGQLLYYKMLLESLSGKEVRAILIDWRVEASTYMVCKYNNIPISLIELNGDRVFIPHRRF